MNTTTTRQPPPAQRHIPAPLSTTRLNVLRIGYLVMGVGLAVYKWPSLFNHQPWELNEGTVACLLIAMSVLALIGLRYPVRMLPILLFEVGWKLLWLGVVALPLWVHGDPHGAAREQVVKVLWVAIVIVVIPWRYVVTEFLTASGDAWRK